MIEPYDTAIRSHQAVCECLGFVLEKDSDYEARWSNGIITLVIATERYYPSSLLASVVDRTGNVFELGLAQRVLSEDSFRSDQDALCSIEHEYGLGMGVCLIHATTAILQILGFASRFQELVEGCPDFASEYATRERDLLHSLGLGISDCKPATAKT